MLLGHEKTDFLLYEIGLLSLKAALSTRSETWPVYASSTTHSQRVKVKSSFRRVLKDISATYSSKRISEAEHVEYIDKLALEFSKEHKDALHEGRLRFGVAQKLVNIHLKYLWTAGFCEEPPHCPLDGIVRDLAKLDYDWTSNDCKSQYLKTISELKLTAAPRSLSVWELQEFRRRAQQN
ncbi:hypothetical protein [Pseudomonas kribbensis]|uniref:hypothetical protein n=1 Tax=Pseudomonas kribbensis TaxID=1628086 RepID=UPI0013B36442|nr:hypothetical protein [Pseudomonas kribbensis]